MGHFFSATTATAELQGTTTQQGGVTMEMLLAQLEEMQGQMKADMKANEAQRKADMKAMDAQLLESEQELQAIERDVAELKKEFCASEERQRAYERGLVKKHNELKTSLEAERLAMHDKVFGELIPQVDKLEEEVKELQHQFGLIEAFLPALHYALNDTFLYRMFRQVLESTLLEERQRGIRYGLSIFCNKLVRLLLGNETATLDWHVDTAREPDRAQ